MGFRTWLNRFVFGERDISSIVQSVTMSHNPEGTMLTVADVIADEAIYVHHRNALGIVIPATCISNDQSTRTIFILFRWSDAPHERKVFSYDDPIFTDFHLLNKEFVPKRNKPAPEAPTPSSSIEESAIPNT